MRAPVRLVGLLALRMAAALSAQTPPPAPEPAATGIVEGRVLGQLGEELANVEVRAIATDTRQLLAKTRTDGEGVFVLGRLPLRAMHVEASAPGLTTAREYVGLSPSVAHAGVRLRLWSANTLRGRVVGGDGKPIAGAIVLGTKDYTWFAASFRSPEAVTDAEGRFELAGVPIGDCVLRAHAPGHAMTEQRLDAIVADHDVELHLVAGEGDVLSVHVDGLPAGRGTLGRVVYYPMRGGSGFPMPAALSGGTLDEQGRLRVAGLPRAEWHVEPQVPGFAFEPRHVKTQEGKLPTEIKFTASPVGTLQLRGVLRAADGTPLAGERLVCRPGNTGSMNGGVPGEVSTDGQGRFAMEAPLVAGEPYTLHLVGSRWVLEQTKVEGMWGVIDPRYLVRFEDRADASRELSLVARPASFVVAKLLDENDNPVPFAWTELQAPRAGSVPRWIALAYATSRRDGRAVFPGVHAMPEDLRVYSATSMGAGSSEPVRLEQGKPIEIVVRVQRPGRVTGRVLDGAGKPIGGYSISCGNFDLATGQQTDGSWDTVPTDRDGRFTFLGVAPGGHKLMNIRHEKLPCSSEVFEVSAGGTIDVPVQVGPGK